MNFKNSGFGNSAYTNPVFREIRELSLIIGKGGGGYNTGGGG